MSYEVIALLLGGYLLGSIPFGLVLTRAAGLGDIRSIGSGNIGATNVLRTGRHGLALATLVLDGLKGAAAVLMGAFLSDIAGAGLIAGLAAVVGHLFPVWLGFRGGKGVATGLGTLAAAYWPLGGAVAAVWIAVARITRISSAGALVAFALAPVFALMLGRGHVALYALPLGALVWLRHYDNIRRLLAGTEPRIGDSK